METSPKSSEAIGANLDEMTGVRGRAINLIQTMYEQGARSEGSNYAWKANALKSPGQSK
jgi:hypothetical protein